MHSSSVAFTGDWEFSADVEEEVDECVFAGSLGSLAFNFFGPIGTIVLERGKGDDDEQPEEFVHPKHIQQPMIQETVDYFLGESTEGPNPNPCSIETGIIVMNIMDIFTGGRS